MSVASEVHGFYLGAEPPTDPAPHADLLGTLPRDLPDLVAAVQGLGMNLHAAPAYGLTPTGAEERV